MPVRTNARGILLIVSWELLRLRPYKDAVGKLTVGYGHLIQPSETARLNRELTREEACELFLDDLAEKESGVLQALGKAADRLSENQLSALVSFAFNVGVAAFAGSTLLKKILAGELLAVPAEFARWTKGTEGGVKKELRGLVERRKAEVALWNRKA
jgi:lysozyme